MQSMFKPYVCSVLLVLLAVGGSGCSTLSGAKGWWSSAKNTPGYGASDTAAKSSTMVGKMGEAAKGILGQFQSMGTVVSSAYGKAKTAVTAPFTPKSESGSGDPTSLANMPNSIGPELWVSNGQLYESQGQFGKALDNYTKALETEPNNISALVSTARLYDRQGQSDRAAEFFQKAIKAKPSDATLYNDLGLVYQKQGNVAASKDSLQKAIAMDPKNVRYHNNLASVLVDNGQADEAVKQLAQVHSPAVANYNVAYLHFNKQNIPAAQQHLQVALQQDPNLQPARDLMNRLGGSQSMQAAANAYQMAGSVMQTVQGIGNPYAQPPTARPTPTSSPVTPSAYSTPSAR